MNNYTLKEVISSKEISLFMKFPLKLYKGYDNWVCPLESDIEKVFDPQRNKMFVDGEAIRYIVLDQKNKCVGRIAAFYNELTAKGKDSQGPLRVGGCGFFESINNQTVATMLFDAAKEWLVTKGCEAMDGPINFGDREVWWGLLTEGFQQPVYGMTYNHIYYKSLFEEYGFQNYFDGISYKRDLDATNVNPTVIEKARRIRENPDYQFRSIKKSELEQMAKDFCAIYKSAWSKFEGIAEITEEQAIKMMKNMKPIIDEQLIYFAYYKGEAIGFYIMVPDLNSVIKGFKGKMGLINKLKFLYLLKIKKVCRVAQGLIFGVKVEHQGKGIESGIIDCFREKVAEGLVNYDSLELTWIGDFNPLMMRMVESYVGATRVKCHTTYRYLFDRNRPFERAPKVSVSRNRK